jgi:DNA-binding transcriptional LysR family regulator
VAGAPGAAPGLPEALAGFHRAHPGIRVALRHAAADEAADLVRRGSADLAVAAVADAPGIEATPLRADPLLLLVPPGDPLDGATGVDVWTLRDRPFVLAEPGTALRDTVVAACEAAGFGPVPLFEVGDPETVRVLVAAGLGVALVPAAWRAGAPAASLAPPVPVHEPALLARPDQTTPAAALLHAHLRHALGSAPIR